ncbi:MarR family transcriptional regulator [Paenibacillus sp. FSL H8-0283]|uniref:MarR family transcriptional regulator n=1 Tax=Paenibacillus sp. FSL H8-0283 TaxID=2921383 RepID=UPI003253C398
MGVKQSKNKDSVKVTHDFLLDCAKNKNLTKKSYRVLLYLLTIASSKRLEQISQKEISEELDMDKSSVSLAIRSLVEEGYISHIPFLQSCLFIDPDDDEY